jgi:hypothetical protein
MPEPRLSDFIGKRLKDIYHEGSKDRLIGNETPDTKLVIEFENDYKIIVQGVGQPGFMLKKERISDEPEDEKKAKQKEKKQALAERKAKESKQKNRKKEK